METIEQFIENGFLKIVVKTNAKKNEIVGEINGLVKIAVKAPAEMNKANRELVKFLSKMLKKNVEIVSGLTSKQKVLKVY
jgi:uncharacterized protein (TIGR00251 family)